MLKHPLLTGAAMIVGTLAIIYGANKAHAEPAVGRYTQPMFGILCDAKSQVQSIFDGTKSNDGKDAAEVELAWNHTIDADGDPTCGFVHTTEATIVSVEDKGEGQLPNGDTAHFWFVEIQGLEGHPNGWLLDYEKLSPSI